MLDGSITGPRGVDPGVRDVAAQAGFYAETWRLPCINLAAKDRAAADRLHAQLAAAGAPQIEPPAPVGAPGACGTPGARTSRMGLSARPQRPLWGATPPPSERMKAAQKKIGFAGTLFRP